MLGPDDEEQTDGLTIPVEVGNAEQPKSEEELRLIGDVADKRSALVEAEKRLDAFNRTSLSNAPFGIGDAIHDHLVREEAHVGNALNDAERARDSETPYSVLEAEANAAAEAASIHPEVLDVDSTVTANSDDAQPRS